jgi:hypothetical protein
LSIFMSSRGRRCRRLRSRQNSAALRFCTHIHRPYCVDVPVHCPHRPYCVDVPVRCRRAVVAAGDYVRAKTPLRSVLALTSIAPTALTSPSIPLSRRPCVPSVPSALKTSMPLCTFCSKNFDDLMYLLL